MTAAAAIREAVVLAMSPFAQRLKLDGRDPPVKVAPAKRSGYSPIAGGCGSTTWQRSYVVFVVLPHVALQRQPLATHRGL
jgi:hypothetical protein